MPGGYVFFKVCSAYRWCSKNIILTHNKKIRNILEYGNKKKEFAEKEPPPPVDPMVPSLMKNFKSFVK